MQILGEMRMQADVNGDDLPVIYTDINSAFLLRRLLASATGHPGPFKAGDYLAMFDGVKIRKTECMVPDTNAEWCDYFGPLADILPGGMPLAKD